MLSSSLTTLFTCITVLARMSVKTAFELRRMENNLLMLEMQDGLKLLTTRDNLANSTSVSYDY